MKKFFLLMVSVCASVSLVQAQDCMTLFPTTKGTTMTTKNYDGSNNLISTTTYTIGDAYEYVSGADAQISFSSVDVNGDVVDQGTMDARCNDGNFYLKQINRMTIPECQSMLLNNLEIMGSFLDYPNTFASPYPYDNTFEMDGAEFTIKDKTDGSFKRVRVYNRELDKSEKITTPAGSFDTSKITYMIEVYDSETKSNKTYKGVEWYALNAGIVRSEVYAENGGLQAYNVMTDISSDFWED